MRVRGERNTILMPGLVNGRTAVVNYVRNGRGEVSDVWILSAREAALPLLSAPLAIKPLVPDPSALPSYTN